jgi:hypothetical protein
MMDRLRRFRAELEEPEAVAPAVRAFRVTLMGALAMCVATATTIAFWYAVVGFVGLVWAALFLNVLVVGVLWLRRHRPSVAVASATFLGLAVFMAIVDWSGGAILARAGYPDPRPGLFQLSVLIVALLAPAGLGVTVASLLIYLGSAMVWVATHPATARYDGYMLMLAAQLAVGLLVFRWYLDMRERAAVRARTEAVALQRFAKELLAMRDLANTPLQTLEIQAWLLRREHPETIPVVERIDRALARLHELSRAMARDRGVAWPSGTESFDARSFLLPRAQPRPD